MNPKKIAPMLPWPERGLRMRSRTAKHLQTLEEMAGVVAYSYQEPTMDAPETHEAHPYRGQAVALVAALQTAYKAAPAHWGTVGEWRCRARAGARDGLTVHLAARRGTVLAVAYESGHSCTKSVCRVVRRVLDSAPEVENPRSVSPFTRWMPEEPGQ